MCVSCRLGGGDVAFFERGHFGCGGHGFILGPVGIARYAVAHKSPSSATRDSFRSPSFRLEVRNEVTISLFAGRYQVAVRKPRWWLRLITRRYRRNSLWRT